jgi:hypothetical protein
MIMLILVFILTVLLVASGVGMYYVVKAAIEISQQNQAWENFYDDSLEDIGSVVQMLDELMNRRQMISDDPDIQNVYRVVVILHDILVGYIDAKDRKPGSGKGKES